MNLIVAVDEKWGIGKKNDLLFHLKKDMKHFVEHTSGKTVVMGANTLRSFPGGLPLKNRTNIVLNPDGLESDAVEKGYILVRSLPELFATLKNYPTDEVYVIGGAMMYRTLLPYCDVAYITKVSADGGAEVFHENLDDLQNWTVADESAPEDDNGYVIRFCTYKNNSVLKF